MREDGGSGELEGGRYKFLRVASYRERVAFRRKPHTKFRDVCDFDAI